MIIFTSGQCCPKKFRIFKKPGLCISKTPVLKHVASTRGGGGGIYCTSCCVPPGSESLTLSNLQFSSPHFSLVVGDDNRGFILKPSRFLSLVSTDFLDKYPPRPNPSPPPVDLLSRPHLPIGLGGAMSFYFDSILLICTNYAVKMIRLLITEGQEPRYRVIEQLLMLK